MPSDITRTACSIFAVVILAIFAAGSFDDTNNSHDDPPLPLEITQSNDVKSSRPFDKVIWITNKGTQVLSVSVVMENKTFHRMEKFNHVLGPGQYTRVGSWEWSPIPGETVTVNSAGYRSAHYVVHD